MLKIIIYIVSLIFVVQGIEASTIRVASYNIWNPEFELKYHGQDSWEQRMPNIINNMIASNSDLILLQEVSKKCYEDLVKNPEMVVRYSSFYIPHQASKLGHKEGRDGLALFFKSEKLRDHRFLRSKEGKRPTHRRDYYVDFEIIEEKLHFRVAGIHVDAEEDVEIGNRQLVAFLKDVFHPRYLDEIDFVVVTGDFNEGEDEEQRPRAKIMESYGFTTDGSTESSRPEALNVRHKGHVDWIYFKNLSNSSVNLIPQAAIGDESASDHKLIMTDIVIY